MVTTDPTYRRFGSHADYLPAPRARTGGLGSTDNEQIPQTDQEHIRALQETLPEWNSAPRSRSRFAFVPTYPDGHGYASSGDSRPNPSRGRDPAAGKTSFTPYDNPGSTFGRFPDSRSEIEYRNLYDVSLGQTGPWRVRNGIVAFFRHRHVSPEGRLPDGPGIQSRPTEQIRWSDAGPAPVSTITPRFTLRREFSQDAQRFSGLRNVIGRGAHLSTSPQRMAAPRTNRLTERTLPTSFGATTALVGGGTDGT